ncbi:hypothetical protein H0E87_019725, partial [Populus deltoides]
MSIPVKLDLNQGLKPQVLVAYRMAVASILIAPFARLRKEFKAKDDSVDILQDKLTMLLR